MLAFQFFPVSISRIPSVVSIITKNGHGVFCWFSVSPFVLRNAHATKMASIKVARVSFLSSDFERKAMSKHYFSFDAITRYRTALESIRCPSMQEKREQ